MAKRNVAILLFDGVEVLDFCGPFEVFAATGGRSNSKPFNVFAVAESLAPIKTIGDLSINPVYALADCPRTDILLVPGGNGTRKQMENEPLLNWLSKCGRDAELLLSVCTGALLLAKAGLLNGLSATTHHSAIELLKQVAPRTTVVRDKRIVDNGRIILSAGIAAGIDMSLHVVSRLLGAEAAAETAAHMEYDWPH